MKPKKRTWKVTLTVVNDIRGIGGSLTKLISGRRLKFIISDEINNWRDLEAKNIKVEKV
jgi:hypothetical protein